jgi:hypothetical protein
MLKDRIRWQLIKKMSELQAMLCAKFAEAEINAVVRHFNAMLYSKVKNWVSVNRYICGQF